MLLWEDSAVESKDGEFHEVDSGRVQDLFDQQELEVCLGVLGSDGDDMFAVSHARDIAADAADRNKKGEGDDDEPVIVGYAKLPLVSASKS